MPKQELESLWDDFSKMILALVPEVGGIRKDEILYIKRRVEMQSPTGYKSWNEPNTKKILNHRDIHKVKLLMEQKEEYSKIITYVTSNYKIEINVAEYYLYSIMHKILSDTSAGEDITNYDPKKYFIYFMEWVEDVPPDSRVKLWIKGIKLDAEEHSIDDNIIIRQIKNQDFEIEIPFDSLLLQQQYLIAPSLFTIILDLNCKKYSVELEKEIDLVMMLLRLFRLGSAYIEKGEYYQELPAAGHKIRYTDKRFSAKYNYIITSEDISKIQELNKIIRNNLSSISDSTNPIHIALQRYADVLVNIGNVEADITTTINCLEALYLKKDENSELSHRLSQRVSGIVRFFNSDSKNVYENIKYAYAVRSSYIHGQVINKAKRQKIRDTQLAKNILDYARISILVFIQLNSWKDKGNLIKIIDNSLLDLDDYKELKEKIEECIYFEN